MLLMYDAAPEVGVVDQAGIGEALGRDAVDRARADLIVVCLIRCFGRQRRLLKCGARAQV